MFHLLYGASDASPASQNYTRDYYQAQDLMSVFYESEGSEGAESESVGEAVESKPESDGDSEEVWSTPLGWQKSGRILGALERSRWGKPRPDPVPRCNGTIPMNW